MSDVEITTKFLVEKYGVVMGISELAETLKITERSVVNKLDGFGISYRKEGRSYIIPTVGVASFIHRPNKVTHNITTPKVYDFLKDRSSD